MLVTNGGQVNLGPKDVHVSQRAAMPSREDFDASPDYPLVMTANPAAPGQVGVRLQTPLSNQLVIIAGALGQ
jgi:hypothetical protein